MSEIPMLKRGGWKHIDTRTMQLGGASPKSYVAFGALDSPNHEGWIAKQGRLKTKGKASELSAARECVTEAMLSVVGNTLPINIAASQLVRLPVKQGLPHDVRFMSRNFVKKDLELVHGVELVAMYLGSQRDEIHDVFDITDGGVNERRFYNVNMLLDVLDHQGKSPAERRKLKTDFTKMLAFDALVGSQDRHAMNWGLLISARDPLGPRDFAPIFDTARGLFWQHRDPALRLATSTPTKRQKFVADYAEKSRPVFGCTEQVAGHEVNHFRLIAWLLRQGDEDVNAAVSRVVRGYCRTNVERALTRHFRKILTPLRLELVGDLLSYRHNRLMAIIDNPTTTL